jgi:hypothetical protein
LSFQVLSKLAFICNVCFLATLVMHFRLFLPDGAVNSTVIIIGQVVSFVVNIIVNALFFSGMLVKKWRKDCVPAWLPWVNFLFLLVQLYYQFFFQL